MTGNGPVSMDARRSSCVVSCSVIGIPRRFASGVPEMRNAECGMRNGEGGSRMLSRSALLRCELLVDDLLERVVRLRAADRPAVDEEGRRSVHACLLAVAQVGVDFGLELVRVDTGVELGGVEAEFCRVLLQIRAAQ